MRPRTPHPDDRDGAACSRFPPVRLTPERLDGFHTAAKKTLSKTMQEYVKLGSSPIDTRRWKYLRSQAAISVYLDRHQEADTQNASVLVAGTVKGRLDDVMEGLYMDKSEDTRLVQHRFHPRFVDAEVLEVIERRSSERPYNFTGLKWSLLKSSNTGIVSNRDLCFLEKLGTVNLADGRKLGYFIMQSVNLRECPPSTSSKIVRAQVSLCYLFEETKNGIVGIYMTGNMVSYGPKILWKLARSNFANIALSVGNTINIAHAKRYTKLLRSKHELESVKPSRSTVCELCRGPQSFFERHNACAGCQKMSVCKKCRDKREVFHREDHLSLNLARALFCHECIEGVRQPSRSESREATGSLSVEYSDPPFQRRQHNSTTRSSGVSNSIGGYGGYTKHGSFASTNPSTASEDDYEVDIMRDSERSMRVFSYQIQEELYNAGYDEADEAERLTGLAILGAGEDIEHSGQDRESEDIDGSGHDRDTGNTCFSFTSSAYSLTDDDDDIKSIQPVRRSIQPPEMLEAQRFTVGGTMRSRSVSNVSSTSSLETNASLLSRLMEATKVAEETHKMAKEHAQRVATPRNVDVEDYLRSFTI